MRIVIRRGTHEIGGSCVELQAQGKRLLVDIGMPLVNEDGTRFSSEGLTICTLACLISPSPRRMPCQSAP